MHDLLHIRPGVAIPLAEIALRTSRSSGPGGQHANVTASRVEATFDVAASPSLTEAQRARISARLGPRVTATAQDTRSQHRNRELALERLAPAALLAGEDVCDLVSGGGGQEAPGRGHARPAPARAGLDD